MADISRTQGRWAFRLVPPQPRSIVELIGSGVLDAELAATVWLLLEAQVPIVVAAEAQHVGKTTLLTRSSTSCRRRPGRGARRRGRDVRLAAAGIGARLAGGRPTAAAGSDPIRPSTTVLLAHELSDHTPAYTWGAAARVAVRAASIGYGLAVTIHADSLDKVFDRLRRPPVRLADDGLSHLGVVLIARRLDDGRRRVVAAHYVRPMVRDQHGHLQRLGPAFLATWDPVEDAFEQFGWGSPRSSRVESDAGRATSRSSWTVVGPSSRRSSWPARATPTRFARPSARYRPAKAFDAPRDDA